MSTFPFTLGSRSLGPLQRVLLVALTVPALAAVTVATVPALVVLPFLPGGTDRAVRLIRAHVAYARTLLTHSGPPPAEQSRVRPARISAARATGERRR
ncbi:dTMP kinase [Kitasatospora sp. NPDC058965]|uniref:dTMP kinase n=1 Tax=Kitasatospora sp. NPDC058965 TaxID=3346682 RepID=UPI0036A5772E